MSAITISTHHYPGCPIQYKKSRERNGNITTRKKEVILLFFSVDMIIYAKNPEESTNCNITWI